jgi:DNA-binding SARP family transcriptional activator
MEVLWPDDEPDVARRKLQIAVHTLRRSLNSEYSCDTRGGYIVFKDRVYQLNPAVSFTSDVDDFLSCYRAGQQVAQREEAVTYYERACHLYAGPFLLEDLYADWSFRRREQLSQIHLEMCSVLAEHYLKVGRYDHAAQWANAVLDENRCDEAAHRQLIQIYAAQGRRSEALHQYQRCERVLREELGVSPMTETVQVFQSILSYKRPPFDKAKIKRK